MSFKVGIGTDIHRLASGKPLIIGGVVIESDLGADGHSDADVLLHAVTDAVLGAMALGDIGSHFPNTDERWAGADSSTFLRHAIGLTRTAGYDVANIDTVVNLERPKLGPYIEAIRETLANILEVSPDCVSVKAKTGEGIDAVGQRNAVSALAIVLLSKVGDSSG